MSSVTPEPLLDAQEYRNRILLALSLLRSRLDGHPAALLVERVLEGWTIEELLAGDRR